MNRRPLTEVEVQVLERLGSGPRSLECRCTPDVSVTHRVSHVETTAAGTLVRWWACDRCGNLRALDSVAAQVAPAKPAADQVADALATVLRLLGGALVRVTIERDDVDPTADRIGAGAAGGYVVAVQRACGCVRRVSAALGSAIHGPLLDCEHSRPVVYGRPTAGKRVR